MFLLFTALATVPAFATPPIARINPQVVLVPSFDGWGTSLCWWAHILGGCSNREAIADLAFSNLHLNIVRYNIGGGEDPACPNRMEARARMPGFEPRPGVWDWQADANQRWFLRAAIARGANHVVAFANSPPYWMTVSGSVTGATRGSQNNLRVDAEEAFAQYLVSVVRYLTDRDGVSFDLLTPMNEPGAEWWHFDGHQEGTHMSPDQQIRLISRLYPLLRENHLNTGLEATEDNDERSTVRTLKSYSAETWQKVALIASHTYSPNAAADLRQLAETEGKPLWISEYGDGGEDGLTMARRIRDDLADTHARAWIYWQFAEPDSPWGLVRYQGDLAHPSVSVTHKFFVLSQFSHFIRPGDQIIEAGDADSLASLNARLEQLVIVSVNDRPVAVEKCFDLTAFARTGSQATGQRTSPQENCRPLPIIPIVHQQLTVTLPAHSVTSLMIKGVLSPP